MKKTRHKAVSAADLPAGQMKQMRIGKVDVLLAHIGGRFYAIGATCPHYGAPLAEGSLCEGRVVCPWHASIFELRSGDLVEPPALDGLSRFEVELEDGDVWITLPEDAAESRTMPMADHRPTEDGRTMAVIGSGAAAAAAVEAMRQADFRGRIAMIGCEDRLPYDRPNCSKAYLSGDVSDDGMPLRSPVFYERHGIERLTATVTKFDVPSRTIHFSDGRTLTPDAVLVATGGIPRTLDVPGAPLGGIVTLRSWSDSAALRKRAGRAKRIVIVGAGFIGMEAAASLSGEGREITVVARDELPLTGQLGSEVGTVVKRWHEKHGTRFELGRTVSAFVGQEDVEAVELTDGGRLPADLVLLALGIRPATDFLEGVPLGEDGGVEVDDRLQLAEGVFAAGDIARYPDPSSDRRLRIEHWRLALQHGRAAGRAMAGRGEPFSSVPFFWTRMFGTSLQCGGHPADWDEVLMTGNPDQDEFTAFYVRGGRLIAAAGTESAQIAALMEGMRTGRLPPADDIRHRKQVDLWAKMQTPSRAAGQP